MFEAHLGTGAMRTQDDPAGVENSLGRREDKNAGKAAKARLCVAQDESGAKDAGLCPKAMGNWEGLQRKKVRTAFQQDGV